MITAIKITITAIRDIWFIAVICLYIVGSIVPNPVYHSRENENLRGKLRKGYLGFDFFMLTSVLRENFWKDGQEQLMRDTAISQVQSLSAR